MEFVSLSLPDFLFCLWRARVGGWGGVGGGGAAAEEVHQLERCSAGQWMLAELWGKGYVWVWCWHPLLVSPPALWHSPHMPCLKP